MYKEEDFQDKLYKKIGPEPPKTIIESTNCPNCSMHEISTSVNCLPIHFLRRNDIDKYIMVFEDNCGGCKPLFYSHVIVL